MNTPGKPESRPVTPKLLHIPLLSCPLCNPGPSSYSGVCPHFLGFSKYCQPSPRHPHVPFPHGLLSNHAWNCFLTASVLNVVRLSPVTIL